MRDSHTSPRFSDVVVKLVSLRASDDGTRLLAKLSLSGTVTSAACDLLRGEAGTIREVTVNLNGEHIVTLPTRVTKASVWQSFARPYPMSATFAAEVQTANLSTGSNGLELSAVDSLEGFGLTGFVDLILRIDVESAGANAGPPPIQAARHPVGNLTFVCWTPKIAAQSHGGELHAYYVRLEGDQASLARLKAAEIPLIARGPDNHYYLAGADRQPEPNVLAAVTEDKRVRRRPNPNTGNVESAFLEGLVHRRAAFPFGSLTLQRAESSGQQGSLEVCLPAQRAERLGIGNPRVGDLGRRVADFSAAVAALYEYVQAVNSGNSQVLSEIAALNSEELYAPSHDLALTGQYALELMEGAHEEFAAKASAPQLAEIQGRICCETLFCVGAERRLGRLSKENVLNRLRRANLLRAESPSLVERVLGMWRSLPLWPEQRNE